MVLRLSEHTPGSPSQPSTTLARFPLATAGRGPIVPGFRTEMRELFKAQVLARPLPAGVIKDVCYKDEWASTAVAIPCLRACGEPVRGSRDQGHARGSSPAVHLPISDTRRISVSTLHDWSLPQSLLITSNTHQSSVSELERQKVAKKGHGCFRGWSRSWPDAGLSQNYFLSRDFSV